MFASLVVIAIGAVLVAVASSRLGPLEFRVAFAAYGLHVVSAFGQEWLHYSYYEFSDMHNYIDTGRIIAMLMDRDLGRFGVGAVKLFLHLDADLPLYVRGDGTPTGSMSAVSGLITFVTGPSVSAVCLVVSVLACLGQLAIYKVVREDHPEDERLLVQLSIMLVPSVVFWSSALAKEAVVIGFFGLLCASAHRLARGKNIILQVVGVTVGGVGVAMVKPYVLFPFIIAAAAWFYVSRRDPLRPGIRPAYLLLAGLLVVVGLAAMGAAFPEFSAGKLGETTAMQQEMGAQAGGGSYIEIGNAEAKSLPQQIPYVPLALVNSLFRPMIFESRNAPMLAAAIETTLFSVLVIRILWKYRWRRIRDEVVASPTLAFSVVFILTFAVAVGLASTNLGTLSRYRMPMMPFYALAILVLQRRLAREPSTNPGVAEAVEHSR